MNARRLRASLNNDLLVAQANRLFRPATRRTEPERQFEPMGTAISQRWSGEITMRLSSLLIAGWFFCVFAEVAPGETNGAPSAFPRAGVSLRYGIDPGSPLESRVKETPAAVLKRFEEIGPTAPTPHPLTEVERLQLTRAFVALPPLHRRVL